MLISKVTQLAKLTTALVLIVNVSRAQIQFAINAGAPVKDISPYIYGINAISQSPAVYASLSDLNPGSDRLGGNRLTGYNWETNASSAGADYHHQNDNWLTLNPLQAMSGPAGTLRSFHEYARSLGRYSIIQLPMAGYVAADISGAVSEEQTAPSARWKRVQFRKEAPFTLQPDLSDDVVYIDECVNLLVYYYGKASEGGVRGYSLDNEPGLWNSTHARIFGKTRVTGSEIIEKNAELARAIKDVDETAETFGLVSWGYWEMHNFSGASDWDQFKTGYDWAVSAYLGEMKKKSDEAGVRLLDVLAIHWYPEARGGGVRITTNDSTTAVVQARLQAPRSLWDPTYKEDSWLMDLNGGTPLNLLPQVSRSIDKWYPETKLAITEYSFGGTSHWSGALAMADVLGVFAREGVYTANLHHPPVQFLAQAFKLYRNVDGHFNGFGDRLVPSSNPDSTSFSIYSSLDSKNPKHLHLIVINKKESSVNAEFSLQGSKNYVGGLVYGLAAGESSISKKNAVQSIQNNSFSYPLPAYSMLHFILSTDKITELPQPIYHELTTVSVGKGRIVSSENGILLPEGTEVTLRQKPRRGGALLDGAVTSNRRSQALRLQ